MPGGIATLLLLAVTAIWGWTFVLVHDAVAIYGVLPFLAVRFAIAAVATVAVWRRRLDRRTLAVGLGVGSVLALGYLFQTWGLSHTTATNSGLITGLFVVLAPVADRALHGTRLKSTAWLAVLLSLGGLVLLAGSGASRLALGDLLTLACAVAFGIHVAVLGRHAPHHDPGALCAGQMLAAAVLFLALWPLQRPLVAPPREVWPALLLTGLVASALAYFVQTTAQRHLSAVRTAVILSCEPVFAGLFGYVLAGERLSGKQLAGAGLILAAMALSEIWSAWQKERQTAGGVRSAAGPAAAGPSRGAPHGDGPAPESHPPEARR